MNSLVLQSPEPYATGLMPFSGPSSRGVARTTRREVDVVLEGSGFFGPFVLRGLF